MTKIDRLLIEIDDIESKITAAHCDYMRVKNIATRCYYRYKKSCAELNVLKTLFNNECNKIK